MKKVIVIAGVLVFLGAATARADYYALLIGQTTNKSTFSLIGPGTPHQNIFRDNVNDVRGGLTSGNWAGYDKPGHTVGLAGGAANGAAVWNALQGLNTLMANDANAKLFFFFSGHGGQGFFGNPELSQTAQDEFIVIDDTVNPAQGIVDDGFAFIRSGVPRARHILFFIDSCYSGGMWNGGDEGDFEKVGSSAIIASGGENQKTPLYSKNIPLLVNVLNQPNPNQFITAVGLGNATLVNTFFQGARRDDIPEVFYDDWTEELPLTYYQSVYASTGSEIDYEVFLEPVPEPSSLLALAAGLPMFGLVIRQRKR